MARGFIDPATTITYKNKGTDTLFASEFVVVGALTACAAGDIPAGSAGEVFIAGQWEGPKKAGEALESGTPVYYDAEANEFSTTVIAGRAVCYVGDLGAEAEDTTVRVILNGR